MEVDYAGDVYIGVFEVGCTAGDMVEADADGLVCMKSYIKCVRVKTWNLRAAIGTLRRQGS